MITMPEIIRTLSAPSANLKTLLEATERHAAFRKALKWSKDDVDNVMSGLAVMTNDEIVDAASFFGMLPEEFTVRQSTWRTVNNSAGLMAQFLITHYLRDIAHKTYENLNQAFTSEEASKVDLELRGVPVPDFGERRDRLTNQRDEVFTRDLLNAMIDKPVEALDALLVSIAHSLDTSPTVLWSLDANQVAAFRRMRRSIEATQRKRDRIMSEIEDYNERLTRHFAELSSFGLDVQAELTADGVLHEPQHLSLALTPIIM